jgi:hypothetical protein
MWRIITMLENYWLFPTSLQVINLVCLAINITLIIYHSFKLFKCMAYSLAIGIVRLPWCQCLKYFQVFSCSLLWSSRWNSHIIDLIIWARCLYIWCVVPTWFYHMGFTRFNLHKSLSNNALKIHFLSPLYQEWGILAVVWWTATKTAGTNESSKEIVI